MDDDLFIAQLHNDFIRAHDALKSALNNDDARILLILPMISTTYATFSGACEKDDARKNIDTFVAKMNECFTHLYKTLH